MFSKKVRLSGNADKEKISVATALVLLAIDELINERNHNTVYGYQIMTHLRDNFSWDVKSGTVYPILKKLQDERYIKNEVTIKKKSRKHQIFYVLTRKGQRLVNTIKNLDSRKLDAALKDKTKKEEDSNFSIENFSEKYVAPFLLDLDNKVSKNIAETANKNDLKDLETIKEQIQKTFKEIDLCKSLLENELRKIEQIKKLKKKG